jgi:hypothetical protein
MKERQGYLIRMTFIPDDKPKEKFISDQNNKVHNIYFGHT